jgi:hypothetical protein
MEAISKRRAEWAHLPAGVQKAIENLLGGRIASAVNCPGGFTPGFASRLRLAGGRRVFVKAMDGVRWPMHFEWHRTEARIAPSLPESVPAPRCIGSTEADGWIAIAFEDIGGREPAQPWTADDLERTLDALTDLATMLTPSPIDLPRDNPRLGGWRAVANDSTLTGRLADMSSWAAEKLDSFVDLEERGKHIAAHGETLVHFDVFAQNILLTDEKVYFVDWPFARVGARFVDLVMFVASAGLSPEASNDIVSRHALSRDVEADEITAVLAANTGRCALGALADPPPGIEAVRDAYIGLARGALEWLALRM